MITNEKVARYYNHIIGDLTFEEVMILQTKVSAFIYEEIYKQVTDARDPSKQPTKAPEEPMFEDPRYEKPDWGSGNKPMTRKLSLPAEKHTRIISKGDPPSYGFNLLIGCLGIGFIIGVTVLSLLFYFGGY